jgi:hypothetical protein
MQVAPAFAAVHGVHGPCGIDLDLDVTKVFAEN